jgi:hypothetical protein
VVAFGKARNVHRSREWTSIWSLPIAVRLFEQNWLYSTPRVTSFGIYPAFGVPVGLVPLQIGHRGETEVEIVAVSRWAQPWPFTRATE